MVNFTPVLLDQLDELAHRVNQHLVQGSPLPDPVLGLLGPDPVPIEPAARLNLLQACLRAHRKNLIERFPPYLALVTFAEHWRFARAASAGPRDALIHDLAVWVSPGMDGRDRASQPMRA